MTGLSWRCYGIVHTVSVRCQGFSVPCCRLTPAPFCSGSGQFLRLPQSILQGQRHAVTTKAITQEFENASPLELPNSAHSNPCRGPRPTRKSTSLAESAMSLIFEAGTSRHQLNILCPYHHPALTKVHTCHLETPQQGSGPCPLPVCAEWCTWASSSAGSDSLLHGNILHFQDGSSDPLVRSELYAIRTVPCEGWNNECNVWMVAYAVCNMEYAMWSMQYGVSSMEYEVASGSGSCPWPWTS